MSEAKRQELVESGALNPDGSRKQKCPTCDTAVGEVLTQEAYDERVAPEGSAVAGLETIATDGVVTPDQQVIEEADVASAGSVLNPEEPA